MGGGKREERDEGLSKTWQAKTMVFLGESGPGARVALFVLLQLLEYLSTGSRDVIIVITHTPCR